MAISLQTFLDPLSFSNEVYGITGESVDSAIAGGFAQWVKGITGTMPGIVKIDDAHVKIVFTQNQIPIMRKWLDDQVKGALTPREAGAVSYELGPVINMWAAKYAVPTVAGLFVAGLIAGYLIHRMRIL